MPITNDEVNRTAEEIMAKHKPVDLGIYSLSTLYKRDFPPQEWLVQDFIPKGKLIIFSGQPGAYKSFVAQHIAVSIVTGQKCFGVLPTTKTRVLTIDLENGDQLVNQRMKLLDAPDTKELLFTTNDVFSLQKQPYVDALLEKIHKYNIGLVIFDSFIRMHNANENESTAMSPIMKTLRKITEDGVGNTTIVLHHDRKSSEALGQSTFQSMRGSSDVLAGVDLRYGFEKHGQSIVIHQHKNRLGIERKPIRVEVRADLEKVEFAYTGEVELAQQSQNVEEQAKEEITLLLEDELGLSKKIIIERLKGTCSRARIIATLQKMTNDGFLLRKLTGRGNEIGYFLTEDDMTDTTETMGLDDSVISPSIKCDFPRKKNAGELSEAEILKAMDPPMTEEHD